MKIILLAEDAVRLEPEPGPMTIEALSAAGSPFAFALPSASDAVDASPAVECVPGSGTFPLGQTVVNCTATDTAGNLAFAFAPAMSGHVDATVAGLAAALTACGGGEAPRVEWLAGADTVQTVAALLKHGPGELAVRLERRRDVLRRRIRVHRLVVVIRGIAG